MNLILLSGNSKRNEAWIYKVESELGHNFEKTFVHPYSHWSTNDENIYLELELSKLKSKISEFGTNYIVFAKSIGIILTLMAIDQNILNPKACLFTGLPLLAIYKQKIDINYLVLSCKAPMTLLQNTNDPLGPYVEVSKLLNTVKVIETPGNTHDYLDYNLMDQLINKGIL